MPRCVKTGLAPSTQRHNHRGETPPNMKIYRMMSILVFAALFAGCKTRETAPPAKENTNIHKAPVPIDPLLPRCNDNDSDCEPGYYCNRTACTNYFEGSPKYMDECLSEKDCIQDDGNKYICLRGRCRSCLNAEECAPGGEAAGWFCWGGQCNTSPPPPPERLGNPPGVKDIPFPPTPPSDAPPFPLPTSASAWPAPPPP